MKDLNKMTLDELKDHLIDVINAREAYPENSLNKKALALDDEYYDTTDAISRFTKREGVK